MEVLTSAGGQSSGRVWIENHPTEGWAPGNVDSLGAGGKYIVVDERGEQFEVPQEKARPVDQACLKGVDDLLALGDFNEGALLHNVRVRYFRDEIYTGIGGPILISMNPFQNLPGLYSEEKQKWYRDRAQTDAEVPPHLFSLGAASHTAMQQEGKNQSIIISGESGAGKTEATKRILAYFANIQKSASTSDGMSLEDQVLRSNPILEAFGNAKTIRNDNSSRFGKYIDIEFKTDGKLRSARISNYLLEKVRIVKQQPDERGYHAFYQLCAGAERAGLNSILHLKDAMSHNYIKGCVEIPRVDDGESYQEMVDCMDSLGFTTEEKTTTFKITAAVLHLGDLEFQVHDNSHDGCKICDESKADMISKLMHVELKDFTKVFQYKTLEDPFTKKIIDMPQDLQGTSNTRHSMAKTLYSRLFDWLVWRINQSTMAKGSQNQACHKIGILDIYGFEVFEWNSFEQLCINFANEKLQQHFNSHMFTLEQQLYTEEGISWSHITFQDNREIIDNLERKPLGLFCILDSECLMPNATDPTCLNKIYNSFKTSKIVYKPSRFASTNFAVAHYAGEVIYDIMSFLEKNTDKLHADIINLLKASANPILKSLFTDAKFAPELREPASSSRPGAAPKRGATASRGSGAGEARAKTNVTVSMMFRQQLDQLVDDLNKTHPRYIRCIKPNANKQAHEFDSLDVQRQLRCAGMLESIRIRRAGYSIRRPFKEFFNRFRVLCPSIVATGADPDYKELSRKILVEMEAKLQREKVPLEAKSWQIGRSKVFLKEDMQTKLEKGIADALKSFVVRIQKRWRGYHARKRFRAMRKAAILVQAGLRTIREAVRYREVLERQKAAITMQSSMRMAAFRLVFVGRRWATIKVQRVFRGWSCRQRVGKLRGKMAAQRIQQMREEEERKEALESAKRAAGEKELALEEMQHELARERERAQNEAQKQIEEAQQKAKVQQESKEEAQTQHREQEKKQELQQLDKLREEMVEMRKENVRLQSQLETSPVGSQACGIPEADFENLKRELFESKKENAKIQGQLDCTVNTGAAIAGAASEAELTHLRRELKEIRSEKVQLEVALATAKTSEEFVALTSETDTLREECSALRRGKLEAELHLEQRSAQLEELQRQSTRADSAMQELTSFKAAFEELEIQLQRVTAQKSALQERAKADEVVRIELREVRLDKMRLEGELETSQMKEAALQERFKSSDKTSVELQQHRTKLSATESELDTSRMHVEKLKDQLANASQSNVARSDSLDQLRTELLSRIESKPRLSLLGSINEASVDSSAEPEVNERKTLLNQRAIFEQLKQQFNDAKDQVDVVPPIEEAKPDEAGAREFELEDEIRQVRKESVEASIRIESLNEELAEKAREANALLQSNSVLQAELQDAKFQLEQEVTTGRRQTFEIVELTDRVASAEQQATSMRRRLMVAEEGLVKAEEEAKAAQLTARRLDEELGAVEKRARDLQAQATEANYQRETLVSQLSEQRAIMERAELDRIEVESSMMKVHSECERWKAERDDAVAERTKIKQVVDELIRNEQENNSEELRRDVEKYKTKASYFEREYNNSKQLNAEMTKVMSQMTQAVAERSDEKSDATHQNRMLTKQLEAKGQELRSAKLERDDTQKRLDELQTTGNYYQDRYREAQEELRNLRHESCIMTASNTKLKARIESLQSSAEDLKGQVGKLNYEVRTNVDDTAKIDKYESHVHELERKLKVQDEELATSQQFAAKSQAVNDCLNTLLVLESEQTSLYESTVSIKDQSLLSQFDDKRSKAETVISRLKEIMTEEERPSIAYMDKRYR